jgi:hypothetical protein
VSPGGLLSRSIRIWIDAHNDYEGQHNRVFDRRPCAYRVQFAVLQRDHLLIIEMGHGSLVRFAFAAVMHTKS